MYFSITDIFYIHSFSIKLANSFKDTYLKEFGLKEERWLNLRRRGGSTKEERWLNKEERWLNGSAPDCKSVVLGSNPAPPQHMANSVIP
jgi:hypothetical protein